MNFLTKGKINWKFIIIFSVIAIVLSAGIIWYTRNGANNNYSQTVNQNTQNSATQKQNYNPNTSLSYSNAVRIYNGRRIQFDSNCIATPSYVVFKKGTTIMLDNRYGKARPVYLDGVKYNIGAYGFKIVTLTTTAKLPHMIKIDCGTGKNNAQIFLEQ